MSIFFYHIFLWLYRVGIRLIAPWNPKAKRWLEGRKDFFPRMRAELGVEGTDPRGRGWRREVAADRTGKYPVPGSSPTGSPADNPTGSPAVDAPATGVLPNVSGSTGVLPADSPTIWMHCSSLGEFEQGRPVIEGLRVLHPDSEVIVSFFSPSGYEARKDYAGADHVFYLPLDSRKNARQFIDLVQPDLVVWIKYDYWYYYLVELKKRKIPVLLISGVFRPDQPFFRWYGRLHRYMLDCFTHLFVQTEAARKLLGRLGLSGRVSITGDTRFDRVIEIAEAARQGEPFPRIRAFCGEHPVIVAGSTWEEDEEELDHYANTHPELRFIIAPHEIGEERLREAEGLFRHSVRYSVWERQGASSDQPAGGARLRETGGRSTGAGWRDPNVLIIDNIGMLSRLYKYATITYIGGGFGDDGVHNVLEAAVYGKPVISGPVIEKYIEAVELVESGGGIVIDSALEAESVFNRLLANKGEYNETCAASRNYVYSKKGATGKIIGYVQEKRLLTS